MYRFRRHFRLTARAGLSNCFSSIPFFPEGEIIVAKDAAQVWLMSNHPEGMRRMMQEDWQNLRRVQEAAGGAKVRMFLAGEELGCVEVEIQRRA